MTDNQNNKLGMFIKVRDFGTTYTTELASVTQVDTQMDALDTVINAITAAEAMATQDTTGFTIAKGLLRGNLTKIVLKCSRAGAAYFLSINNIGMIKAADFTPRELDELRDNDIYVRAQQLYNIVKPVEANLDDFNSGAADVALLKSTYESFFNIIKLPKEKTELKAAYGREVDRQFVNGDGIIQTLDIYMATFEAVNPLVYDIYTSARSIDDLGSGSANNTRSGSINAGTIVNASFSPSIFQTDSQITFSNTSSTVGPLVFYFSQFPDAAPVDGRPKVTVAAGASQTVSASDAGWNATYNIVTIQNEQGELGKWKVKVE